MMNIVMSRELVCCYQLNMTLTMMKMNPWMMLADVLP